LRDSDIPFDSGERSGRDRDQRPRGLEHRLDNIDELGFGNVRAPGRGTRILHICILQQLQDDQDAVALALKYPTTRMMPFIFVR
jgi:hypothetical protein